MEEILILSSDEAFARMLANECRFCGIPTQILPAYEDYAANATCLLVDLDSVRFLPSDAPTALGFFRDPSAVSDNVRMKCRVIFRRPFPVRELQEELYHFSPRLREFYFSQTDSVAAPKSEKPFPPPTVTLDSIHMTASCGSVTVSLSDREFTILSRLYAAKGTPVSKEELNALLGNRDSNMTEVYICRLRRKIEKKLGIRLIESVRGCGYQIRTS